MNKCVVTPDRDQMINQSNYSTKVQLSKPMSLLSLLQSIIERILKRVRVTPNSYVITKFHPIMDDDLMETPFSYISLASPKIMCKLRQERLMVGIQDEGPVTLDSFLLWSISRSNSIIIDQSTSILFCWNTCHGY